MLCWLILYTVICGAVGLHSFLPAIELLVTVAVMGNRQHGRPWGRPFNKFFNCLTFFCCTVVGTENNWCLRRWISWSPWRGFCGRWEVFEVLHYILHYIRRHLPGHLLLDSMNKGDFTQIAPMLMNRGLRLESALTRPVGLPRTVFWALIFFSMNVLQSMQRLLSEDLNTIDTKLPLSIWIGLLAKLAQRVNMLKLIVWKNSRRL